MDIFKIRKRKEPSSVTEECDKMIKETSDILNAFVHDIKHNTMREEGMNPEGLITLLHAQALSMASAYAQHHNIDLDDNDDAINRVQRAAFAPAKSLMPSITGLEDRSSDPHP